MKLESLLRIPALLTILSMTLLLACGDGLSGSAIGQNATRTEALQQELTDMSEDLASLNAYYNDLEFEVEQTLVITRDLIDLSEDLSSQASNNDPGASTTLDDSRHTLWRIENSLIDVIEERERIIGELLGLITADITNVLVWFSTDEEEIRATPTQRFDELFEVLSDQEMQVTVLLHQLYDIEATLKTIDLIPNPDSQTSAVIGGSDGSGKDSGSDPAPFFLYVFSDEQYQEWITGEYHPCTSTPCGHLNVATWNGKEIYVKVSGQSSDPSDDWYWAYIFKYSPSTWVIQYVNPSLTDASGNYLWNAHRYSDGIEPWTGTWDGITVNPISP